MKKQWTLSIVFALMFGCTLHAQILEKGNFVIGSTIGFSAADSKISKTLNGVDQDESGPSSLQFSISPNVGYFLTDAFALGIGMDFTFSRLEEPNEDKTDDTDFLFGPFMRYYFPMDNNMAFFLEADFGFGSSSDDLITAGGSQNLDTNLFAIGAGPGFTIYSDNAIGIEALFKYNYARSKFKTEVDGVATQTITKTGQFDIALGLQFYFSGIQKATNELTEDSLFGN